jgi:peptide/nickel transport system substrate-binding protein
MTTATKCRHVKEISRTEENEMTANERDFTQLMQAVKAGALDRRAFLARAVALGLSLPMARSLLAQNGVSAAGGANGTSLLSRAQEGTPVEGGQVIIGLSQEPTLFNPVLSNLEVDRGVQQAIFDSLWRIDENAAFIPNLATEIPTVDNGGVSEDGMSYTFHLRDDATWTDGTPLTAADVVFTHNQIMNPDIPSPIKLGHDKVSSIEATDDYTITLTLSEPFAPFLIVWSDTLIVPQHILEGEDFLTTDFNAVNPVGSGAFTLVRRSAGESIELAKNPDWHGDGPYLDTVIIKYLQDTTILYTQFRTGEVDYTGIQGITADHYEEALTLQDREVHVGPTAFVEFIYPNFGNPIFQDKAVREAMYYAMDKANIISQVYLNIHTPSETYLAETSWAINPDLPQHEYNPDRAREILEEAGWELGDDGVRVKDDLRLAFTNSTTAGNNVREQAQQYLQQTWGDVGIAMEINNMPPAVIWGEYYTMSQYDTVMVGEISGVGGDPDATARFASSQIPAKTGAGKNTMQYENPEVDELLAQGAQETDQDARREIYFRIQEILRDDLAVLPIFHYNSPEGTKAGLMNYKPNAFVVNNWWNLYEWYWEAAAE